jgi:hypothetical protein
MAEKKICYKPVCVRFRHANTFWKCLPLSFELSKIPFQDGGYFQNGDRQYSRY